MTRFKNSQNNAKGNTSTHARRGRQRKEENAATPAEKRRTQIRLAQRAYRARQEASLSHFKERVSELENVVENLSTIFLTFRDQLVQSGVLSLYPSLAQSLQQTTEEIVMIANQTIESENSIIAPIAEGVQSSTNQPNEPTTNMIDSTIWSSSPHDLIESNLLASWDNLQIPTIQAVSESQTNSVTEPSSLLFDIPLSPRAISSPTYQLNLTPPKSPLFGPQSPSFAKRLYWFCCERAYHYLKNPAVPDSKLSRTFGFLMGFMSRAQITAYFGGLLKYSNCPEFVDYWNLPVLPIGGAGSHYPRKHPITGQPDRPSRARLSSLPPGVSSDSVDSDDIWFDTEDIDGFLQENSIVLVRQNSTLGFPNEASSEPFKSLPATLDSQQDRSQSLILTLDENELIAWLSTRIVCLGRIAGVRKRDLEDYILRSAWSNI